MAKQQNPIPIPMPLSLSLPLVLVALLLPAARGAAETPQYTTVHAESDFEVRLYGDTVWMSAPTPDIPSFHVATKLGFHRSVRRSPSPPGPGRILSRSSNGIVVAGWQIVPVPDGRKPQLFEDQDDHPCAHECGSRCRASALLGLLRPAVPAGEVPGFPSGSSPRAEPASRSVARPLRRSEELLGSCTGQERGRGSREARHEPEPVTMG